MNAPPLPPAERLARLIDALSKVLAARGGKSAIRIELPNMILPGPLVVLIWKRLRKVAVRFAAIVARIEAGTLRTRCPPNCPPTQSAPLPEAPAQPRRPPPLMPQCIRGVGWFGRLVPEGRFGGAQLRNLLAEPDMAALLAEHEQLRRVIRPLCRMFGVPPPPLRPAAPPKPAPESAPATAKKRAARRAVSYPPGLVPVPKRWRLQPLPAPPPRPKGRGPPVSV